jgi:2-dehydropantoate 2-reductase
MRICVVGAGAIGGYFGGQLALAGEEMTLIARGAHLQALQANGLRIRARGGPEKRPQVRAYGRIADAAGSYDVVLLALKAHQLPAVAAELPALFGDETIVVALQNGIPWWYFSRHGGPYEGTTIEALDPGGVIARHIEPHRIIGASIYQSASTLEPGLVEHLDNPSNRVICGELDGTRTPRLESFVAAATRAGVPATITTEIRIEKWNKLLGNVVFNPIGALAHATQPEICRLPESRRLALALMEEALAVARSLGVTGLISAEQRIEDTVRANKDTRSSMRQDAEAGRPLEIDALLGAVLELGALTETSTVTMAAVHACAKLLSSTIETRRVRIVMQQLESAGTP